MSDSQQPRRPLLADTHSDRALRFGCGAVLGALIMLGVGLGGVAQGDLGLFLFLALLVVVACGVFGASHGDRFFHAILRRLDWFV